MTIKLKIALEKYCGMKKKPTPNFMLLLIQLFLPNKILPILNQEFIVNSFPIRQTFLRVYFSFLKSLSSHCFIKNLFIIFSRTTQLMGSKIPYMGIEPGPLAVKAWHPNHWTIREFLS